MLWLLQIPPPVLGTLWVAVVVGISLCGLLVFRRVMPASRFDSANTVSTTMFQLAGTLYAVLVAFVVVVVWEQFSDAEDASGQEAAAIADLLRDSAALPPQSQSAVEQALIDYTRSVVDSEFPRMRHGEHVAEQSAELIAVWENYLQVQPETRNQIAFFDHAIVRLNDMTSYRKARVSTGDSSVPVELWVLLVGGGGVVMAFTFLSGTRDRFVHLIGVGLTAALLAFVMYLIFALEHPYVGKLSVKPTAYHSVLESWAD